MPFEGGTVSRGIIVPDLDGGVSGATRNEETGGVNGYVVHRSSMTDEFVGSGVSFQRGCQHNTIIRTRDYLLHVWTENTIRDLVLVLKERLYQVGVVCVHLISKFKYYI